MKKLICLLLLCASAGFAWAETEIVDLEEELKQDEPFRFKNRMVEFAFKAEVGFANDFLTAEEIFRDTLVVDLTKFNEDRGLQFDVNGVITPFCFNFNWKDRWGFSFFINSEIWGNITLPGKLLSISQADDEKFGAGAAVFAEAGIDTFFHVDKLKIKIKSAGFMPLFYSEPDISYTYRSDDTFEADVKYNLLVYTGWSMKKPNGPTAVIGFDLGAGAEYPLFSFLDLGTDLTHIPLIPATVKDYMQIKGSVGINETDNIFDGDFGDMLSTDSGDTVYGTGHKNVLRPFKMIAWADYRPFNTRLFSVIPSLGFAVNPLYIQPGSVEIGVKLRSDVANILIATVGVNYEDRVWKNSFDLAFNLRAFELDLGIDMRSQDFLNSWKVGGLGFDVGIKMGW
jgi:hypothetical protein